jgi:acetolactate synthase-1/2/3 large subunit
VDWDASPITLPRLASEVWRHHGEDWVLSAGTLDDWARRIWDFDQPYRHPGKSLGTATQIGISLGVALAHREAKRLVVDLQPDGDLIDAGALWYAKHRIPLLVDVNNRAHFNDWEHVIRMATLRVRQPSGSHARPGRPGSGFCGQRRGRWPACRRPPSRQRRRVRRSDGDREVGRRPRARHDYAKR